MAQPKPKPVDNAPKAGAATGRWTTDDLVPQTFANEALLTYVGDQVYLTLGQIQVPPFDPRNPEGLASVEIRPVARIVLTESSFHKVLTMLNGIAARIPKPAAAEDA